ncbi:MAG: N-acetylmuramoyl-L-alanine amidase [Planctomycetes bacterium]|nr:N-acetylmuramoyl-L-alanine amidase [Planctomycetota bacterium]
MLLSLALLVAAQNDCAVETFSREQISRHAVAANAYQFSAPQDFHSVGFIFEGEFPQAAVSLDGIKWPLEVAHDLNEMQTALVHASNNQQRAITLHLPSAHKLTALSIYWINSAAPSLPSNATKPPVYDRASWGANPPSCAPTYCATTHIAMHHTASASEYNSSSWSQCAANVKASQIYHMATRGWCDIGYNYLICPHGDVFEGRGGGDDVRGAHDGSNCGSMGVAMMGYFHAPHNQLLNNAMQDAFIALAAYKCEQQQIDALGNSWYAGYADIQQNIFGHRDVSSTACPGDLAYAELPQLRQRIAAIVQNEVIILDTALATFTGNWNTGTTSTDKYGADYRWASTGVSPARAIWTPTITQAGDYQISIWWPEGGNRNPSTTLGLMLNGRLHTAAVNQQMHGGQWNTLGSVPLPSGATTSIGLANNGPLGWVVVADALRLVRQ